MATHDTIGSLLKESLLEYLHVAEFCINYRKEPTWGSNQVGGCLGCPGTALMFCILDTIGAYHRGRKDFPIMVDGEKKYIKKPSYQHFFILNSEYYHQQLSESNIKKLYENYRNLLLHNAALAIDHPLFKGESNAPPFPICDDRPRVNVTAFLRVSQEAVKLFMPRIDEIVPKSDQVKIIGSKR